MTLVDPLPKDHLLEGLVGRSRPITCIGRGGEVEGGEGRGGGAGASGGSTNSEDGARGKKTKRTNGRTKVVEQMEMFTVCVSDSNKSSPLLTNT